MPIIPLECPFCGGDLELDSNLEAAVCKYCGRPFIVKDAIVHNYIKNVTNINAENVTIYTQKDYVIEAGELKEYKGESVDVVVPDNVKKIGDYAFAGKGIESIKLSKNVKSIGVRAFSSCSDLKSIDLPESVETIGNSAFAHCRSLRTVTIPNRVKSIEQETFLDCKDLTSITIPDSVESIAMHAFKGCSSLISVKVPFKFIDFSRVNYMAMPFLNTPFGDQIWKQYCNENHRCLKCGSQLSRNGKCKYCDKIRFF